MALMLRQRFEFLECTPRPDDDFAVQTYRDEDGAVAAPTQILHIVVMPDQASKDPPILHRLLFFTSKRAMGRRPRLEVVNTHDLVIRPRSEVLPIRAKAHGMHRPGVVGEGGELLGLGVGGVGGVEDRFRRPDANVAVACCACQSAAVGRDVAAVDFVVFLLALVA